MTSTPVNPQQVSCEYSFYSALSQKFGQVFFSGKISKGSLALTEYALNFGRLHRMGIVSPAG